MAKVDLRKVKEQALKAIEKQQHAKAAELYQQIAAAEPNDPDWHQRAGEALRKVPDTPCAVAELTLAAEGYAKAGFLLKAIAVCKVVLQIDAKHTATQAMLAELYATREGKPATGRAGAAAKVDLTRTATGEFELVPRSPTVPPLPVAPAVPAPPSRTSPAPPPVSVAPPRVSVAPATLPPPRVADVPIAIAIDEFERRPTPPPMLMTLDQVGDPELGLIADKSTLVDLDQRPAATLLSPSAPLESLPLHAFLGGQKSSQFNLDALLPADEPAPAAYVIALDDEDLALAEAIPVSEAHEPGPDVHRDSLLGGPPVAIDALEPAPPRPPVPVADETDFSDLMSEPVPVVPAALSKLPKIPLFSSLGPDDLRHLIELVVLREHEVGETIMRQGEAGGSLFVIVSGRVEVTLEGPTPRTLATLGEGAFFGELGLITNFPRSATVIAHAPTQLLEISRQLVLDIVARSPDVLKTLLRFFRDRLLDRLLGESPLFASLPPDEARRLADRFLFLELEPGMRVVSAGERSAGLFLLLCGVVDVERDGAALATLRPGDVFGEMSLLERKPATASIITRGKCWALELPRGDFQEIMVTYPALLEYVSSLAERRKQPSASDERVEFL
jgi:CRP-like cAMP-binding protein